MIHRFHHFDGTALTVMFACSEKDDYIATHIHHAPHTLYVVSGKFEVGYGETVQAMHENEVATIPAGVPHWLRARELNSKAICLLIPRAEDGRVLTTEEMANMSAFDLWKAQERV